MRPELNRDFLFKAKFRKLLLSLLLVVAILLGQGSDSRFLTEASASDVETVSEFADKGHANLYDPPVRLVFGTVSGKGKCNLCHTFDPGDNLGRCPNLFGIEKRSHARIKEDRYLNKPIKVGETDKASGIVKGRPDLIPKEYRRKGSPKMTGEDYLRESMMCPSCYVVKGYGREGDTKSPGLISHKPPINLTPVELNAVIAWLQSKDTPGDYSRVTVPLPGKFDISKSKQNSKTMKEYVEKGKIIVFGDIDRLIEFYKKGKGKVEN